MINPITPSPVCAGSVEQPVAGRSIGRSPSTRTGDGRGIVTIEFAVGTLLAIFMLTTLAWMIFLVGVKIAAVDAAGGVARQVARGDRSAVLRAEREGPKPARYRIDEERGSVGVTVTVDAAPIRGMPVYPITATAVAVPEPGVGGGR